MAYVVGITGGIACGKTLVSNYVAERGYTVIDTDVIAREVVAPDSAGLAALAEAFGPEIIAVDESLDRAVLGEIVFADAAKRQLLNDITHPLIEAVVQKRLAYHAEEAVVFLIVPLLYEVGYEAYCDEVWLLVVDEKTQLERLIKRNGYTPQEAQARIGAGLPLAQKIARGPVTIDNRGPSRETLAQVTALLEKFAKDDA